eukprot:749613-Hanusia_phi.AAC.2
MQTQAKRRVKGRSWSTRGSRAAKLVASRRSIARVSSSLSRVSAASSSSVASLLLCVPCMCRSSTSHAPDPTSAR